MSAADIPCYPNGERVPGHEPQNVAADLFTAMGALHGVLDELETEYENTVAAADLCPSRRQRRGLEQLAARCEHQLNLLRQFFDWDVYLDRASQVAHG